MRIAALSIAAVAVLGCDQGARPSNREAAASAASPTPMDHATTPVGTITGKVTHTMNGPGRAHTPEESFSTTTPMTCNVRVIDPWGNAFDVAAPDQGGGYRAIVPVGQYTVSFAACAADYCAGRDEQTQHVSVAANAVAEASFDCEVYAK